LRNWDKNCNGVLKNSSNSAIDEVDIFCWTYIEDDVLGPPGSEADKNYNQIHDCDETPPFTASPCCEWGNINNANNGLK